jgi:hypothetical protein
MKALTLTEPWASLMMLREKKVETRSWRLPPLIIGQEVAIHAAMGFPKWAKETCTEEPFFSSLRNGGNVVRPMMNRGKVLCVVKFVACHQTEAIREKLSEKEIEFGDYADGRFAFVSEFVRRIDNPVPALGHLGFWNWEPPIGTL